MTSRRVVGSSKGSVQSGTTSIVSNGALSLESEETAPLSTAPDNKSLDVENNNDMKATYHAKIKHWRESAFACALTEPTWEAEGQKKETFWEGENRRQRYRKGTINANDLDSEDEESEATMLDVHPDTTGCLCCSALICPLLGASRVGNMAVLHSANEWVEEVEEDLETGECKVKRYTRPKLWVVVGPYWPMLVFVTYPLIFGVSGWAFYEAIWPGKKPLIVVFAWLVLTIGLIVALGLTGCRDPGILYRHAAPPAQYENSWRWNDQTQSYRPRRAFFDSDTAVLVEEFDHTCPWTGTAIGKKNMLSFQFFVCLVFVCLIVDIFLITGAF